MKRRRAPSGSWVVAGAAVALLGVLLALWLTDGGDEDAAVTQPATQTADPRIQDQPGQAGPEDPPAATDATPSGRQEQTVPQDRGRLDDDPGTPAPDTDSGGGAPAPEEGGGGAASP